MSRQIYLIFSLCLIASSAVSHEKYNFPKNLTSCRRDGPSDAYNACLLSALQKVWPSLVNGIPDYDMPSLDPKEMHNKGGNLSFGMSKGMVHVNGMSEFGLYNTKAYGLSNAKLLAIRTKFEGDKIKVDLDVEIPKLIVNGNYVLESSLFLFKVGGKGYFNVSMDGFRTTASLTGSVHEDRWLIEHFKMSPLIDDVEIHSSNVFNGLEAMHQAATNFFNKYWRLAYTLALPAIQQYTDVVYPQILNEQYFSKIPISKLFY